MKYHHIFQTIVSLILTVAALGCLPSAHAQTTITFDTDASGNPLIAPQAFIDATPLTTLYASLGVTFSGPGSSNGGAILNESSDFGINALSGENFFAFNRDALYPTFNPATTPERITFATPQSNVSIYAAGGVDPVDFTMLAFDKTGNELGSDSITASSTWGLLSISAPDISLIILEQTSGTAAVFDNLSFTPTPEPATLALVGLGGLTLLRLRHRRM